MNIGILSFRALNRRFMLEEKRLCEEAEKRGHKVTLLRFSRCMMIFDGQGKLDMRYGYRRFPKFDLIIPRASVLTNVQIKIGIIKHLQLMKIPMLNTYQAILSAKSKLQTLQLLSHFGIPVVRTATINSSKYLEKALQYIGDFPVIMKTIYGSYGEGVAIVESARAAKSTYGILAESIDSNNAILLQEYIAESKGKDIRLFVIGGEFVAAMERVAQDGEFRSNVGQGGSGQPYTPTENEIHLAIRATKALNLEVAGVDIIQTRHGPAIMEVNANPGFEELEQVSGVNVALAIMTHAERFVQEYVG